MTLDSLIPSLVCMWQMMKAGMVTLKVTTLLKIKWRHHDYDCCRFYYAVGNAHGEWKIKCEVVTRQQWYTQSQSLVFSSRLKNVRLERSEMTHCGKFLQNAGAAQRMSDRHHQTTRHKRDLPLQNYISV